MRARVALWMGASAAIVIFVFGLTAWALVRAGIEEENAERSEPGYQEEGSEDAGEEAAEQILGAMAIAAPISLLVAIALGFAWSRRITRPLNAMIATASTMTTGDLSARLEVPVGDDEVARLAASLNEMFERIELGFAGLDRHVTEASHELRTPIAVVSTQLEVALRKTRTEAQWTETANKALHEIRRMGRMVDSMLRLARSESKSPPLASFDLAAQVVTVASDCAEVNRRGLGFAVEGAEESIEVLGDQDAISIALRALIDNAEEHAADGGKVTMIVESACSTATVHIDDDGRGIAAADRQRIFEPFVRGPGRSGDHRGLGLGLSIATRLVAASGGELRADDSPSGGARFSITLPRAV